MSTPTTTRLTAEREAEIRHNYEMYRSGLTAQDTAFLLAELDATRRERDKLREGIMKTCNDAGEYGLPQIVERLGKLREQLVRAEQEKAQAVADIVRMATTRVGEKCEHHRQPVEILEQLAIRECPICWKQCAEGLQAERDALAAEVVSLRLENQEAMETLDTFSTTRGAGEGFNLGPRILALGHRAESAESRLTELQGLNGRLTEEISDVTLRLHEMYDATIPDWRERGDSWNHRASVAIAKCNKHDADTMDGLDEAAPNDGYGATDEQVQQARLSVRARLTEAEGRIQTIRAAHEAFVNEERRVHGGNMAMAGRCAKEYNALIELLDQLLLRPAAPSTGEGK